MNIGIKVKNYQDELVRDWSCGSGVAKAIIIIHLYLILLRFLELDIKSMVKIKWHSSYI